ncbi:LysR family transcriptional regulator [Pseudenhygromyxa sp. WMMC2535]|uniref:LysR family transcriptional regulator n=1 Tax=Pseudenhygromyxa sp. WMMC2535 TaxID=2712867 RepID=UPI001553CBC2|nr:LysR family transcriptional regulator [Pseudenhygromyxa sp. WMMC2535]NVB40433.1 LysR family transcriptional regulator [Pseudenhygromyxa sp. WMMC2535]
MDWNLLHTFESVVRLGSLSAAAEVLGVSQSTVSRQLSKLEAQAGSPLLLRGPPLEMTARGEAVLAAIEPMIAAALAAESALEDGPAIAGEVTVSTVGEVLRWVLIDALPSLRREHPRLRLRLLADNAISSLAAGEADVALRFVRPTRGELVAQRVGSERYGFFVDGERELDPGDPEGIPWLGLTGSLAKIPEQRYAERAFADRPASVLVEDVEALGLAVAAGLGVAVLPKAFAARLGLREVAAATVGAREIGPLPARELWMVVHGAKQGLPRVRAVMAWLADAIGEQ